MRILAIDIGGTAIKIGLVNEQGQILETKETATMASSGGEALMGRILNIIGEYKDIDRVGISTAGQVDPREGKVIFASDTLPGWTGMEIKKRIEKAFNIPTAVENDVNAAALGEACYGAAVDEKDFLCLTYGTGIGGAIVQQGEIYRGSFGSAGEFGHIITHVGGRDCTCRGKGCYEAYASTTALLRKVKEELKASDIDGREIFRLLQEGREDIKAIVDEWIFEIAMGLVSLIHIFNPSLILLGGGIMSQPYILDQLKMTVPEYIMPNYNKIEIRAARLGNNAGLLGAAHLAMLPGYEK